VSGLVQPLEGETGGQRAVADDGDDLLAAAEDVTGRRQAESGGDGSARVADIEAVVRALVALGKAADAARLAQGGEALPPAGQQLVGIGLMAYVPDGSSPLREVEQ
jgi:hypothetical protein